MISLSMASYSGDNSSIFAKRSNTFLPSPSITDSINSIRRELSMVPSNAFTSC